MHHWALKSSVVEEARTQAEVSTSSFGKGPNGTGSHTASTTVPPDTVSDVITSDVDPLLAPVKRILCEVSV